MQLGNHSASYRFINASLQWGVSRVGSARHPTEVGCWTKL